MNVTSKKIGANQLRIYVTGKINIVTSEKFHDEVSRLSTGFRNVIFDFSEVTYISSAGLREILIFRKKFFTMRIENVHREVYSIFKISGFTNIIEIDRADDVPEKTNNVRVSFKRFLRDKTIYFSDEIVADCNGKKFSWRVVSRCATIIAADLSDMNVKQGDHVAICCANSINWILTFFAIQKLGAIAVLVNFNLDPKKIADLCASSNVMHFCYGEMSARIDDVKKLCGDVQFYSIQSDKDFRTRLTEYKNAKQKIYQTVYVDDPAVMIFTSDTNKGVLLSSFKILNAANVSAREQTLTIDDKTCMILPFFADFGLITGFFANALTGSTIYLPKDFRADTILDLISRERCTIFHAASTVLLALLNDKRFNAEKVSSLRRTIIFDSVTDAQIEKFRRVMPNNQFMISN